MTNVNYDTGIVNMIRQLGVYQLKRSIGSGVVSSAQELKNLASKTVETEDDILSGIISQNFQVFASLDNKPGVSSSDLDFLMMSTDVIRNLNNSSVISASEQIHQGIVEVISNKASIQISPSRLVSEVDAIQVFNTELGRAVFYISEGNISVTKDDFVVNQRGIRFFIELSKGSMVISEKSLELPIPTHAILSSDIRSSSVSKEGNNYKVDIYLSSLDNRVLNGVKVSYFLDSSLNVVRDEVGKPGIEFAKLSPTEVGRNNLNGLASLGNGQYVGIQNRGKEGIFFFLLQENLHLNETVLQLKDHRSSIRNIKLGNVREKYPDVDLSNYSVRAADTFADKVYVLLVGKHNKNQHYVLTLDKNSLENSNITLSEGFDVFNIPSDALGFSDIRNMSVSGGRVYFFVHPQNRVRDEDFGEIVSFDLRKLSEF
jgi:hypothetical protein